MADLRRDTHFKADCDKLASHVALLSAKGVPDAIAISDREDNVNNLSGHAHSIVPLAVAFARAYPHHLETLKRRTDLHHGMGQSGSQEARDPALWDSIKADMQSFVATRGGDVVADARRSGEPQTVAKVADAYLSERYGGSHTTGGAGDTTLKRSLKLLAHIP